MTLIFALFAEVERDLISERTRKGLAKARSSGTKLGRPNGLLGVSRIDGKEDEIRSSSISASRKARSLRSPASPDRLSTTSTARETSSRVASVYFYTNLVSNLYRG